MIYPQCQKTANYVYIGVNLINSQIMNVQIATSGDITDFKGDVIILPCDVELSYTKSFLIPHPMWIK